MTDVTLETIRQDAPSSEAQRAGPAGVAESDAGAIDYPLIELLFFAYRDFIADADAKLEALGFGRAHHRVLHFVNRNPGLRVSDLLDILKITKQSLGRVLKQLVDEGFVVQSPGASDRRERLLHTTPRGEALALELAGRQSGRIARALRPFPEDTRDDVAAFLTGMINDADRSRVEMLTRTADRNAT